MAMFTRHRRRRRLLLLLPFVALLPFEIILLQNYIWTSLNVSDIQLDELLDRQLDSNIKTIYIPIHKEEERNYHYDENNDDDDDDDNDEIGDDEKEDQERGLLPNSEHIGVFQNMDRIYYINVDKRKDKSNFMESWLKPFSEKYSIPYQRISAKSWDDSCNNKLDDEAAMLRCRGVKGLRNSNLHIMDTYNTTGYTLVLEDDFQILNYTRLLDGVKKVPDDWDVIRFDCWGKPLAEFPTFEFGYQTSKQGYCGGTHATLWRSDRLHILRKIWKYPKRPSVGIDCLLADEDINSYCVQADIGQRTKFKSDIPKTKKRMKVVDG
jgi:hypothetical protein